LLNCSLFQVLEDCFKVLPGHTMSQDDYRVLHTTSKTCNLVDLCYNHKQARIVPPWSLDSLIIHDSELGQSVVQGCINLRK